METRISAQAEQAINTAAALIGTPDEQKAIRFIYTLGYMAGALAMAQAGERSLPCPE